MTTPSLPLDHELRMDRVRLALDGLSVGDAFGQCFFTPHARFLIQQRAVPKEPWDYTDDTEMALGITEVLQRHGRIDRDDLATTFSRRFVADPLKGYGGMAIRILGGIARGEPWRAISQAAFEGQGSAGNGGAMRVAPVGAYFADDLSRAATEARLSAEVTHAHAEGQAGGIAIGVAAAWAVQRRERGGPSSPMDLFDAVLQFTPPGETRHEIEHARLLELDLSIETAVRLLGNGSRVIAQDTVPYCIWCIARHLDNYEEAMWQTLSGLGDMDTTCAIVGGVVALACGPGCVPANWLASRQPLEYEARSTQRSIEDFLT